MEVYDMNYNYKRLSYRFLGTLKKFVRNKARPEGSIAEAYIDYECITFMSMYLKDINQQEWNYGGDNAQVEKNLAIFKEDWQTIGASTYEWCDELEWGKAHYTVLNNCDETLTYLDRKSTRLNSSH